MHVEVRSSGHAPTYRYNHIKLDYHYMSTTLGYVAIQGDLDVLEFVHDIPTSRVQNLLQPQLIQVDVQDDVNIADVVDDEYEDEATQKEDEEQQLDEEEDVNVDGEDDEEERMQFIDSEYEEQDKQKGA
ncbi:unnamed protein product [Prunus armeniaca]|uniref:Uncharacterized protein n=1 Tax=Prunus armeniaca TaxID=36596 RepID=A0A6J5WDV1_PRUAR|nr:unnamed protein product [Prunus armeniaca]CAB4298503.1 unnamed protein product [Prunus armeniaca]